MRVPIMDSRGVTVRTCPPAAARHMIQDGQAIPRRDAEGGFYLQLVLPESRRRARESQARLPLTRRARLAHWARQQNYLLSVLADPGGAPYPGDSEPVDTCAASHLDHLLVIDIESTCWPSTPPEGERAEIIEIGLCVVDVHTGQRLDKECILVRPERSRISPFCTALTTITPDQVAGGVSFAAACALLHDRFQAGQRPWASYGDYDRRMFQTQCAEWAVPYPFTATHVNVKHLVSLVRGLKHDIGLLHAMQLFDLPVEGTHHRGVDDAWNTALIASTLILQRRAELA